MAIKTSASLPESTMTRMQELGSAWVFKRAIQDNVIFNSANDILNDKVTYNELKKIWKTVGKVDWNNDIDYTWVETFYKQQATLLQKIGKPNFTEFCRDGGKGVNYILPGSSSGINGKTFMSWISDLVKKEFNIGQKDSWNPADIWLIQNESKWRKKIQDAYNQRRDANASIESELAKFNSIFRALFRSRQIIGISLKKVGKGPAQWKEVNVSGSFFRKLETTEMTLTGAKCILGTTKITEKAAARGREKSERRGLGGAATLLQDTVLYITDPGIVSGKKEDYTVQIKANSSTDVKGSNLKWEPTPKSATSARLGKATVELVLDLMGVYGILRYYERDHTKLPKNKTEFIAVQDDYERMIDELINDGVNVGGVDTVTAIINIKETYDRFRGQPYIAKSKLQQIQFLYALYTLPKKKRDAFCTSLIFTAEKAGKRYGPYGKLY